MSRWYWRDGTVACDMDAPDWREQMSAVEEKLRDRKYKVVKQETLPNGYWLSTVWLGLDHGFRQRPPRIFESMVFESKTDLGELDQRRYSTEAEALVGHEELKAEWSTK